MVFLLGEFKACTGDISNGVRAILKNHQEVTMHDLLQAV